MYINTKKNYNPLDNVINFYYTLNVYSKKGQFSFVNEAFTCLANHAVYFTNNLIYAVTK